MNIPSISHATYARKRKSPVYVNRIQILSQQGCIVQKEGNEVRVDKRSPV